MMTKSLTLISALVAVVGLSACGDKPQSMGGTKSDVPPFQGVQTNYAQPGWKAGDKTSWEQALKARAQYSQNEYSRTTAPK